jgi:hypothetical protein
VVHPQSFRSPRTGLHEFTRAPALTAGLDRVPCGGTGIVQHGYRAIIGRDERNATRRRSSQRFALIPENAFRYFVLTRDRTTLFSKRS